MFGVSHLVKVDVLLGALLRTEVEGHGYSR
jgi:hypothetical protein